jgi:FixJ family two-component response regulator
MAPVADAGRTVYVVDDDASLRTALSRLLRAAGYHVQCYASAAEFLLAAPSDHPACLLLDVEMTGASGLDLQAALAGRERRLPIVFLTAHGDIPMTVRAMRGGASDFLTKPVTRDTLLPALEAGLNLDVERQSQRERLAALRGRFDRLTPREREVFLQVAAGLLNKQIAGALGCSIRTVKVHRARVMEKMEAGSVADLVRAASDLGVATTNAAPA